MVQGQRREPLSRGALDIRERNEDATRFMVGGDDLYRYISDGRNELLVFCSRGDIVFWSERERLFCKCARLEKGRRHAFFRFDIRRGQGVGFENRPLYLHGDVFRRLDENSHASLVGDPGIRRNDRRRRATDGEGRFRRCHGRDLRFFHGRHDEDRDEVSDDYCACQGDGGDKERKRRFSLAV